MDSDDKYNRDVEFYYFLFFSFFTHEKGMVFVNFLLSTGLLTNRDHRLTILLYRLIENKRSRCYYAPGKNGKATEKYEISQ